MGQDRRPRKADNPALRAAVEALRRAGEPVQRQALARQFGVGVGTVQTVRSEIDAMLAAENVLPLNGSRRGEGGRTVTDFDADRLLAWRKRRTLLQEELAGRAGISRGEVGHLERGRRKPTLRTLRRLADALEIGSAELLAPGEDHYEPPASTAQRA
jgi:DNA-binding XRE family transcriptional regulator